MDLKKLREDCGLTQEELASRSGVSRPAIHRIENGQQAPRRGTVKKLAQALGMAPWEVAPDLFTRPGEQPPGLKLTSELHRKFEPYIATLARKIARNAGDVEDLEAAGREGLFEACRKFKEGEGMDFEPWAKNYVRNRILDEARRHYEKNERTYGFEETLPPEWEGDIPDLGTMSDEE